MSTNTHISIKNWSDDDKPREKMMAQGKNALSDAELLAILIGSGSRNESALELSRRILTSVNNNLTQLGKLTLKQLQQFKGVGEAKAITILAATELGRRRSAELPEPQPVIKASKHVFQLMQPIIGELAHEEFWGVFLNNANRVLHKTQLSKGGITQTVVDVRLLFKAAIEWGAVALILVHNHPSGNLTPSQADRHITQKIKMAGESLDIRLLDHIILNEKTYFSFADEAEL